MVTNLVIDPVQCSLGNSTNLDRIQPKIVLRINLRCMVQPMLVMITRPKPAMTCIHDELNHGIQVERADQKRILRLLAPFGVCVGSVWASSCSINFSFSILIFYKVMVQDFLILLFSMINYNFELVDQK